MAQSASLGASAPAPSLAFAGYAYLNWDDSNAEPPVVLNPKASLHSKLAWCWGEASRLHDLACELCQSSSPESQRLGELLLRSAMPLEAMLEHIGEITRPQKGHDHV